jgi:hypothetical protein
MQLQLFAHNAKLVVFMIQLSPNAVAEVYSVHKVWAKVHKSEYCGDVDEVRVCCRFVDV